MNDIIVSNHTEIVGSNTDELGRVVNKALQQIEAILDMELPEEGHEDRMKMLSVKKDAASSIINAGLKADENRFRRENKDIIEKLYEKIRKDARVVDGTIVRKG